MKKITQAILITIFGMLSSSLYALKCHNIHFKIAPPKGTMTIHVGEKEFKIYSDGRKNSLAMCINDGKIVNIVSSIPGPGFFDKPFFGKFNFTITKPGMIRCLLSNKKINCNYTYKKKLGSRTCHAVMFENEAPWALNFSLPKKDKALNFSLRPKGRKVRCIPTGKLTFRGTLDPRSNSITINKSGYVKCESSLFPPLTQFECQYVELWNESKAQRMFNQ